MNTYLKMCVEHRKKNVKKREGQMEYVAKGRK